MKLLQIKARFNTDERQKAVELGVQGIDNDDAGWEYRPFIIRLKSISYIEEFKGFCLISLSGEFGYITNVPISQRHIFGEIEVYKGGE